MHVVHAVGTAALWVCALSALGFCGLYHLSAPWWRSAEGRHLMSFTGGLALIFSWLVYRSFVAPAPPSAGDEVGRMSVYLVVAVLLLWRLELLWRRQIWPGLRRSERTSR